MGFTDEMLAEANLMKAVGCDHCKDGYKGRVGVYEVVRVTPDLANTIMEDGNALEIHRQAQAEGFRDLRESALRKVAQGLISLEEANRITVD
jgi:type IV pilus assembly protein PilB